MVVGKTRIGLEWDRLGTFEEGRICAVYVMATKIVLGCKCWW